MREVEFILPKRINGIKRVRIEKYGSMTARESLIEPSHFKCGKHYFLNNNGTWLVEGQLEKDIGFRVFEVIEILEKNNQFGYTKMKVKFKYCKIEHCCCCDRPLTDEFSINNGIGPTCAKKLSKERDYNKLKADLHKCAESLGEFELWMDNSDAEECQPVFFNIEQTIVKLDSLLSEDNKIRNLAQEIFKRKE